MKLNQTINQRVRSGTVILYDYFFFLVFNFYLRFERNWFRGFLFFFHFQLKTKQNKKRSEETKRSFFVFVYFFCSSLYQRTKKKETKKEKQNGRRVFFSSFFFLFAFHFFSEWSLLLVLVHLSTPLEWLQSKRNEEETKKNSVKLGKTR